MNGLWCVIINPISQGLFVYCIYYCSVHFFCLRCLYVYKHDKLQSAGLGGITPALYNLGNALAQGHGVPKDEIKAAKFYDAACVAGDPAAKFTFGTWLYTGKPGVVPVDKARSFTLQLEAAKAGHGGAMFNTGCAFMEGVAVKQDFTRAAEWFEKAADMKIVQANINLGNLHREGMGVKKDLHKALEVFSRFASVNETCAALAKEVQDEINTQGA